MATYFDQQNNPGIMAEENDENENDSISSSSSLFSNESENSSDFMEDATSSSSSSSSEHINGGNMANGSSSGLFEMTSLIQQLPFKRGLSKHFNGKSQSFTSLANVKCLEDLAKPENPPLSKKMKSCKSYGGLLLCETNIKKKTGTKTISKKSSSPRGSWSSSLSAAAKRNNSFLGNKPPMPPPQRSSTLFNQTPLFA